ncbi:MAG: DUF1893 domain-containing protein [Muribaculaceae bacterium]|nr:DUF1893 domain-containing protein [Muribaculaceae bacterium]
MLEQLIEILREQNCSLVVECRGEVRTYHKKGVRDLVWLLDHEPWRLKGALVADKVVGKASAGLLAQGGVSAVYAQVLSRLATPLLDHAGIAYRYGELVDRIVIPDGDTRCPLEQIVAPAHDAPEVERCLRQHFEAMRGA